MYLKQVLPVSSRMSDVSCQGLLSMFNLKQPTQSLLRNPAVPFSLLASRFSLLALQTTSQTSPLIPNTLYKKAALFPGQHASGFIAMLIA